MRCGNPESHKFPQTAAARISAELSPEEWARCLSRLRGTRPRGHGFRSGRDFFGVRRAFLPGSGAGTGVRVRVEDVPASLSVFWGTCGLRSGGKGTISNVVPRLDCSTHPLISAELAAAEPAEAVKEERWDLVWDRFMEGERKTDGEEQRIKP
ncbi:hypothetical protein FQA47_004090 [Oryzias melastigma]|uniref:Uncharacterized protein n=1 Tax=Oryzias melastigma TaxID=30732 RepID=A0A834CFP5_ORYME|nr:hypothetical protein FQA47_004090 [Oryzias melastigma]